MEIFYLFNLISFNFRTFVSKIESLRRLETDGLEGEIAVLPAKKASNV
jgi:hypothetical protein